MVARVLVSAQSQESDSIHDRRQTRIRGRTVPGQEIDGTLKRSRVPFLPLYRATAPFLSRPLFNPASTIAHWRRATMNHLLLGKTTPVHVGVKLSWLERRVSKTGGWEFDSLRSCHTAG